MPKIPLNIINKEIDKLGELVTLTIKSSATYSDWGDETPVNTTSTRVKAIFNVYGKKSSYEKEGNFQDGEITFFFRSDQTGITNGTKVTRANGDIYEIQDYRDHGIQGNIYVNEALVRKI
jgi:hypothetical protein